LKKQLAKPFNDNLDTKDSIETMANEEEGATQDFTVKTLMTHKHLHNMSLDLSLEDFHGPTHKAFDLSTKFLIQLSVSTFHLSWPSLVSAKALSSLWPFQYQELNGSLTKVLFR
jgi:hypothetical protein